MLFHFPLMIGLILVAKPLITLLLTDRWAPSIPYFQLFCIVGLLYPMHIINLTILSVVGRSDLFLRLEVIKKILIVVSIVITYRWGITAILYGQIGISILAFFLNSFYSEKLIGYSIIQQIHDTYIYLLLSLVMGVIMYWIGEMIGPNLPKMLAEGCVGMAVYIGINWAIGGKVLTEVIILAQSVLRIPRMEEPS